MNCRVSKLKPIFKYRQFLQFNKFFIMLDIDKTLVSNTNSNDS